MALGLPFFSNGFVFLQVAQGRDDRQMVFLPPGSQWKAAHGTLPNLPFSREAFCEMIFPNQPYEEKKYR